MQKIDKNGRYCDYQGLTVIAKTLEKDKALWQGVHHRLTNSAVINKYFSSLPSESYHMTTMNLFTAEHDGKHDWHDFIVGRLELFRSMHAELKSNPLKLSVTVTPGIHLRYFPNVIQLNLDLAQEARDRIEDIAKKFDCSQKIPLSFHMTLAYQYNYIPPQELELMKHVIENELNSVFKLYAKNTIDLQEPALCSFTDMTSFIPWNGEHYPFAMSQPYPGM